MPWNEVGKLTVGTVTPGDSDDYMPIRSLPQKKTRWGFSKVISNSIDSDFGSILLAGSGQSINQAGGSLVITSCVTANSETIIRGKDVVVDCFTYRWSTVLSQRITSQSFVVELVDVIGDNLAYTVNSTTSVTVTVPNNTFTAVNIGQKISWSPTTGAAAAGSSTQDATIASIAGNNITFTLSTALAVSSGTGNCSLFGWNYHRIVYDGTSATTNRYITQRNGWPGPNNSITMSTTATPGHIGLLNVEDNVATIADQLRAISAGQMVNVRGGAWQDMPDGNVPLYFQIRVANGGSAPASTTTWTIAFADCELYTPQQVSLTSGRPTSPASPFWVNLVNTSLYPVISSSPGAAFSQITAATTNAASIKTSRAGLAEISIFNATAATIFVKLYNKASAPTVGTDVPLITIPVAAGVLETRNFGGFPKYFSTGLALAVTANAAASDATAVTAGAQISATFA